MTAILAIDYYYRIIVISDCRVTWSPQPPRIQDNLQKVYPLGPTGVFGFSGGIAAAKAVVRQMVANLKNKPLPPSAVEIAQDISACARDAYSKLPSIDKIDLQLMYVAADYGNEALRAKNVKFARNVLVKMEAPDFEPVEQSDYVALGYAVKYPSDTIRQDRDSMLRYGLDPLGQRFQIGVSIGAHGEGLATISGDPVGGLFTVGIVDLAGVRWSSYSYPGQAELRIEGGRFVQYDLVDGRRIPLKTLLEFDPRNPESGSMVFNTPSSRPSE